MIFLWPIHQKALTQNYHKLILESRDRKEAEDELVRSELQYHEALDCFPDWVIVVDRGLNIIMANSMLRQSVADAGLPSELKGRNLVETFLLLKQAEIDEKVGNERKLKVGTGERSEKIRTYNYPQNRVTDHRIGFTINQLDRVMEGQLESIIEALVHYDQQQKLLGGE